MFLDTSEGIAVQDMWLDMLDAHNQNIKITGYPTEKNPDVMRRIIQASSRPGDLVLDAFSGSGTTLAVTSQLGRRWIGMDNSPQAIVTTLRRFAHGLQPMGDYVGGKSSPQQKARKSSRAEAPLQLSLAGGPATLPSGHAPIQDFTLLLESATGRFDDAQRTEAQQLLSVLRAAPPGRAPESIAQAPTHSAVQKHPDGSGTPATLWSGLDAVG